MSEQRRILIIDDDAVILNSIEKQLKSLDMMLDFTASPVMGLSKLETSAYDLVICDIRMQPVSGVFVLQQIKDQHPDLPVIILSGYVDDRLYEETRHYQASAYLIKPVRKATLIETIRDVLSGKDMWND